MISPPPMADGNVPFQNVPRYAVVGNMPCLHVQTMLPSTNFTGVAQQQPLNTAPDPVVTSGLAAWSGLNLGGLFRLGSTKQALAIDAIYTKNASSFTINVIKASGAIVPAPTTFPFKLAPTEMIQVISGGATSGGAEVGVTVRFDVESIV